MKSTILEKIEQYPLSAARRSFTLVEILHRAQAFGLTHIVEKIEEALDLETQAMHERLTAGRYQSIGLSSHYDSSKDDQLKGQRAFLALILYIQRTCPPSSQELLLAPLHQQIGRLHYFAHHSALLRHSSP